MENIETNVNLEGQDTTTEVASGTTEKKTFTEEEVMALLQSEADKRVTAALKKQQAKFDKQLSLAKLDEADREKVEKDDRIAELEEQLSQFQLERNKIELKGVLMARGLSPEFADLITITDDAQQVQVNVEKLDKLFKASVKAEVEKRLAGNTPKGNGNTTANVTKDAVKNMNMAQLNELARTNPELFSQLFN